MPALDDAREEVERRVGADLDPVLTAEEVETILAKYLRYTTWASSTAYAYGAVVVPATRTGQRFRAVQGGISGATTPFQTVRVSDYARVTDGTVIWEEAGEDSDSPYDLR